MRNKKRGLIILLAMFIFIGIAYMLLMNNKSESNIKGQIVLEDTSKNEGIAVMPLGMYMSIKEINDTVAVIEISNQSGYEMVYSEYFSLEKEENGEWVEVPILKDVTFRDDANVIKDLEKVEVTCDLKIFGDLEIGKYRLIKDDMMANFEIK